MEIQLERMYIMAHMQVMVFTASIEDVVNSVKSFCDYSSSLSVPTIHDDNNGSSSSDKQVWYNPYARWNSYEIEFSQLASSSFCEAQNVQAFITLSGELYEIDNIYSVLHNSNKETLEKHFRKQLCVYAKYAEKNNLSVTIINCHT